MHRISRQVVMVFAAAILAACTGAVAAAPTLEQTLAQYRRQADRLAAARQYDRAIAALAEAKEKVQEESRQARRPPLARPGGAAYRKELAALVAWLQSQEKLSREKKGNLARAVEQYTARKAALDRKHGVAKTRQQEGAWRSRQLAEQAPYSLLLASLDDRIAEYQGARGEPEQAAAAREQAALTRLRAYQDLKRERDAERAADRLLALKPSDPESYSVAGRFYQERRQYGRAAEIWERAVGVMESGKSRPARIAGEPGVEKERRNRQLEEFYRQLAFCYHKLNRNREMQAALEKAGQLGKSRAPGG